MYCCAAEKIKKTKHSEAGLPCVEILCTVKNTVKSNKARRGNKRNTSR
jgi:hypothetical protein